MAGYLFIRAKRTSAHKICMLGAFGVSSLFLISYLTYHYVHGSTPFTKYGWIRKLYFSILISHTILAVTMVPFILVTLRHALRSEFDRHRRIARYTFPVWLYVSVTGVIIYALLYHY